MAKPKLHSAENDAFHTGVLAALGVVYYRDAETIAAEIVDCCDEKELLRIAKAHADPYLKNLRATVQFLRRQEPRP